MVVWEWERKEAKVIMRYPYWPFALDTRASRITWTNQAPWSFRQCHWNGQVVHGQEKRLVGQVSAIGDGEGNSDNGRDRAWKATEPTESPAERWVAGTQQTFAGTNQEGQGEDRSSLKAQIFKRKPFRCSNERGHATQLPLPCSLWQLCFQGKVCQIRSWCLARRQNKSYLLARMLWRTQEWNWDASTRRQWKDLYVCGQPDPWPHGREVWLWRGVNSQQELRPNTRHPRFRKTKVSQHDSRCAWQQSVLTSFPSLTN